MCGLCLHAHAQDGLPPGAKSQGMGFASSTAEDVWAIHNNPAALTGVKQSAIAFTYQRIPSAPFFDRISFAYGSPLFNGVGGVGVHRFGDDLYNEQQVCAAFSNRFGLASLGVRVTYFQIRADGHDTRIAIAASFGGLAHLTEHLRFSGIITHVNQPVIDNQTGERLITRMTAGLAAAVNEKIDIAMETTKQTGIPLVFRAGFDYKALKKFAFRTGVNLNPASAFCGAGFHSGRMSIDYAFQFNNFLGESHQATIAFHYGKE